jgi:hypothetical protein
VTDINDGKRWSEMDVEDLKAFIEEGATIEEAAEFLCRSGTVAEVRGKGKEQRLDGPGL